MQSRLFQNEDMSCRESTEKLLPYGAPPQHMATHACGIGTAKGLTLLLPAEPLFRLVILQGDLVILVRGFVNCIIFFFALSFLEYTQDVL